MFGSLQPGIQTEKNSCGIVHLHCDSTAFLFTTLYADVLFQMQAEFMRMTRVNMVESLQQFWTAQRMEIAIARLQLDKVAGDIVSAARQTNIIG